MSDNCTRRQAYCIAAMGSESELTGTGTLCLRLLSQRPSNAIRHSGRALATEKLTVACTAHPRQGSCFPTLQDAVLLGLLQ